MLGCRLIHKAFTATQWRDKGGAKYTTSKGLVGDIFA